VRLLHIYEIIKLKGIQIIKINIFRRVNFTNFKYPGLFLKHYTSNGLKIPAILPYKLLFIFRFAGFFA